MNNEPHCHGLAATISEYLDGELSPELCDALEHHLSECPNCTIVVNTMRKTIELYRQPEPEQELPADVKSRLYQRLHIEDYLK